MRLQLSVALRVAVLVLASQPLSSSSACQHPFTRFGGHCAYVNEAEKISWCDAAARCLQIGGELLIDIAIVRAVRPSLSGWTWIGATDLLEERNTSRTGWQLTNGSLLEASSSDWENGMPNNFGADDDMLVTGPLGLNDRVASWTCAWACQPIATPNSTSSLLTSFRKLGNISPTYCFTEKTAMYNKFHCLALCARRWQCRAALHNSNDGRCRMLDFTDATVEAEIENDVNWKKFVKVY